MIVVFNGVVETHKSGGCTSCGRQAKSSKHLATSKSYFLPSGRNKTFVMGRAEEVSDEDGNFLLSYIEHTEDGTRRVFDKV